MIDARSGVWWMDGHPERRVSGTLTRETDHWRLDVIGTLPWEPKADDSVAMVPSVTIYGACLGRRYTLVSAHSTLYRSPGRRFDVPFDERDGADDQHAQRWWSHSLLEGDALSEDALYEAAMFEVTGLSTWWPRGGLRGPRGARTEEDYHAPEATVVDCGDGLTVTIFADLVGTTGPRVRSLRELVAIQVEREAGFTLETLAQRIIMPLRSLISIAFHEPVYEFDCRLQPLAYRGPDSPLAHRTLPVSVDPEVVDAVAAEGELRGCTPTFTADDVDVSVLIPKWLRLAEDHIFPVTVAQPHKQRGTLQTMVVEAVNAAETLHRGLHAAVAESDTFTNRVWEALKLTGLNRKDRDRIRSAIRSNGPSLEKRLAELANDLGEEFCEWFFDGRVAEWALVAASIRNALSHGYGTDHRLEWEAGVLVGVHELTLSIIRLRLLVEAGLPRGAHLIDMVAKDPSYRARRNQRVVDWRQAAAAFRG
ncbi:HEPN domain-containing protein [Embleya sp. MST-111070]|uniref:ApeA N-terminal domain 1-containing protein n=1 Tax=Embleya sp. MST-111070 TaxID=3398231 RepID=UPI003F731E9F